MSRLHIRIVAPTGVGAEADCDSISLIMADDRNGRGGGSIGIRDGFANSMIAVAPGPVEAKLSGQTVLKVKVGGGFATVKDNLVTVLAGTVDEI